jgi:hypothetical protein
MDMFVLLIALPSDDLIRSSENDYIDMNPGPNSGDAFDREIASDGLNAITWFKTNRDLILGTLNEEFLIKSSDGKAISNTNISILSQTSTTNKALILCATCIERMSV